MVIVYESKTGFTKKYADMLAAKTGFKAVPVREISKIEKDEDIIFLGWMKAGMIQGLNKVRKYNIKAVCCSGLGKTAEPDAKTVIERNNIGNIPFFYLRGGCLPLKQLKGMDKFVMSLFVKMLKSQKNKDEMMEESINYIMNGFDGVKEESLEPVIQWLKAQN